MYRVFLERAAERDLKQLSAQMHDRLIDAVQALGKKPRPVGCRKLTGADNDWRIRVGDYRIVYEIDDAIREVRVKSRSTPTRSLSLRLRILFDAELFAFPFFVYVLPAKSQVVLNRGNVNAHNVFVVDLPVTDAERALLDARLVDMEAHPDDQSPWPEVKARLERLLR